MRILGISWKKIIVTNKHAELISKNEILFASSIELNEGERYFEDQKRIKNYLIHNLK